MANDEIFTATTTWQPVQIAAVDIKDGTFSVFNINKGTVEFIKSDTLPSVNDVGTALIDKRKESVRYTLAGTDRLYVRAGVGTADVGVIPA